MAQTPDILNRSADFDSAADFEAFLKQVPAKWVVYLLADADDRPLQLLCVKNLRASLKRRLGPDAAVQISKRLDYRQIVRRVHWRQVDSALEADWIYHVLAKELLPDSYQGMLGMKPAWFVHVNPEAEFPRYVKTIDLCKKSGIYVGPVEDKHAAARLIQLVEDAFDLCRYYNILTQAPHGRACAYKEMGKCPAPCDGSISMEQYRFMIDWSLRTLVDPSEMIRQQNRRMQQAAEELRFEMAAKIKAFIDQLSQFGKGAFAQVRALSDFAFVTLQRGPREGTAKMFLILRGSIEELAGVIQPPPHPSELMRLALEAAEVGSNESLDAGAVGRIGIVSQHLLGPKTGQGVFIPLSQISEPIVVKAYKDLLRQKPTEESQDEGVVKELQAL